MTHRNVQTANGAATESGTTTKEHEGRGKKRATRKGCSDYPSFHGRDLLPSSNIFLESSQLKFRVMYVVCSAQTSATTLQVQCATISAVEHTSWGRVQCTKQVQFSVVQEMRTYATIPGTCSRQKHRIWKNVNTTPSTITDHIVKKCTGYTMGSSFVIEAKPPDLAASFVFCLHLSLQEKKRGGLISPGTPAHTLVVRTHNHQYCHRKSFLPGLSRKQ